MKYYLDLDLILQNLVKLILISFLLSSCAGIPGNKIRLEDYPEINQLDLGNLDLGSELMPSWKEKPFNLAEVGDKEAAKRAKRNFTSEIASSLGAPDITKIKWSPKCVVKISSYNDDELDGWCGIYYVPTFLTLFIVPYYCQRNYEAKATLISTSDNRVLKEYYLKDKVHEVWSALWFLSTFVVDSWGKGPTPKGAIEIVERNISRALSRQILNDAKSFSECQKHGNEKAQTQKNKSN